MSKLEYLIQERCPNGVPTHPIGELFEYQQPTKNLVSSTDYVQSGTPVLTAGQTFILGYTKEKDGIYKASSNEPVIIFDDFTTAFKWVDFDFKAKSSAMKMIRAKSKSQIELRYLFHWMGDHNFRPGEHSRHWISVYSQIQIPWPPLDVQKEIVSILDKFTQLEAELEAELEARRSQFSFFCDKLFSEAHAFEKNYSIKTLGEKGSFQKGSGLQKTDFRESGMPCIHYGQIHTTFGAVSSAVLSHIEESLFKKLRKAKYGDLIIADTAEDLEGVAKSTVWLGPYDVAVGGHSLIYAHTFDPKFIAYYTRSSNFQRQKNSLAKGVKVKDISAKAMSKILVPVPPIEVQRLIGETLSQMDALVSNIVSGLPAEITLRRKQYEYYRNKLLTFEELDAA